MSRIRQVLEQRPIAGAVAYTVVGVLPLYLTSAQGPRLQSELGFGKAELGYVVAAFFLVASVASRACSRCSWGLRGWPTPSHSWGPTWRWLTTSTAGVRASASV